MTSSTKKIGLAKQYKKLTDKEHILQAPDTYIGSIEQDETNNWIFEDNRIINKSYKWIPGLYKCFDEGIVNARDHYIRMKINNGEYPVKSIEITIDKETGMITIQNDGNGIDVEKHPEHNIWIPEMIFGHLRTSTNYNKNDKKIVGGKNGFGFKLVLIYSTYGKIETIDHVRGLKYIQEFKDNLNEICKPSITKTKVKPYTKVSFIPDYKRFGIESLSNDMIQLFTKRIYDIAAVTDKNVRVKLNKEIIPVRSFENYIDLYIGNDHNEQKRIYESANERWEYAVCLSPNDEFLQVSFVNGINTGKGGKHVEYILNQIIRKLTAYIEKKKKVKVKSTTIKEQLMLFINCVVENPSFDSQTKDYMNTAITKFGSSCVVSDKFIDKLAKIGVMQQALSLNEVKQNKDAKKTDGKKTKSIKGIPKLIDANYAGGNQSHKCTLILCEGDSAKSGIVSGLSKEDRNFYGVYPLKGKLMNVNDSSIDKIGKNNEINDIKKIIGLENNKNYDEESIKNLRYGKIVFMTDQDLDGSHIKGLGVNLFHSQWHDLFKAESFIGFMNTPILKATKSNQELSFYNEATYNSWKNENDAKGWNIKYYKGLGTSTSKEFKEYFKKKKMIEFNYKGTTCDNAIDLVFNKSRADDRKVWLSEYNKERVLSTDVLCVSYDHFVNDEFIHFSKYDCERSIPNLMDGLKTSQRKILFSAFKRNLNKEIKVAQFSGYVSEHSMYHHGEASLNKAIVGMAQNFVGSNNINLLLPNGQFGTRLLGGKDSASERYIFTQLNKITSKIFIDIDQSILNYLKDDGTIVEPEYYLPIIPVILVNGSKGIGTGFSTEIINYNPMDLIQYIKSILMNETLPTLLPYYNNFRGDIIKIDDYKYLFKGKYTKIKNNVVRITELPIGIWTQDYKEHLEFLMEHTDKKGKKKDIYIKDYNDMSTDLLVDINITLPNNILEKLLTKPVQYGCNEFEKIFNLYTTRSTSNMHLFDHKQQLKKYNTIEDIITEFYPIRLKAYQTRKEFIIKKLEKEMMILYNKARFIEEQCNNTIDLRNKKKDVVQKLLENYKYDKCDDDNDYKYLIQMPISSLIEENIDKLRNERDNKRKGLNSIKKTSIQQLWLKELTELENILNKN